MHYLIKWIIFAGYFTLMTESVALTFYFFFFCKKKFNTYYSDCMLKFSDASFFFFWCFVYQFAIYFYRIDYVLPLHLFAFLFSNNLINTLLFSFCIYFLSFFFFLFFLCVFVFQQILFMVLIFIEFVD